MENIEHDYLKLLSEILNTGVSKDTRNGKTLSIFGRQIRHKMSDGFPLLTTKKMPFKTIITELLWFLRGDTNIKYLVDNNCHIWDGDAYKSYAAKTSMDAGGQYTRDEFINKIKTDDGFAKQWGGLGPIYGKQWRKWDVYYQGDRDETWTKSIDQIANLINDLKTNPDSRRLMVNAWNVGELDQMTLPPCHYGFQVYTRELSFNERWALFSNKPYDGNALGVANTLDYLDDKNIPTRAISLMWNQRSVDTGLGLGFNIASYGLLLEMIAKQVNMTPDELIGNLGDVHLYLDHVEPIKEQLNRKPFELPTLKIHSNVDDISHYKVSDFELIGYQYHPTIKLPLSN